MSNGEKTGSRAILDAVSPTTRAGMLESLSELGVTPHAPQDAPVLWRNLRFERHGTGLWLTADHRWKLQNAADEPHWVAFLQFDPDLTLVESAPTAAEAIDKLIAKAKDLSFKLWAALDPVTDP